MLHSTREEGARLRVPPRGRGAGDDQWCSPPSSCASPLPPLGESAVVGEAGLLVVIPPSPRFALPGLDAGVVGQSVTRFLPGSRRPARVADHCGLDGGGSSPVRAARPTRPRGRSGWGDPGRGLPRPRRRGPSRPGPLVPAASHCGPRHRSPNSNRSRAGASQEPPPRQGTHPAPPIREIAG